MPTKTFCMNTNTSFLLPVYIRSIYKGDATKFTKCIAPTAKHTQLSFISY